MLLVLHMPKSDLQKHGTVQAFNVSPKGAFEGLLLKTGSEIIQVNFPQEYSAGMVAFAPLGSQLQVRIEEQDANGKALHPVYKLISAVNSKEEKFPGTNGKGPGGGQFSGEIARLNYALHGEVNGGILDSGDFLHLKPHGAEAVNIRVGLKVKGTGTTKAAPGGQRVIEAQEVNGIRLEKKPKPKKRAHA